MIFFFFSFFQHTFESWRPIFWIVVVAQMVGCIVFFIFGSAKIQDWNYPEGEFPIVEESTTKAQGNNSESLNMERKA